MSGSAADPCPQGYYCPPGTAGVFVPCPVGTFGARNQLTNVSECTLCTGGSYCNQENLTAPAGPCQAGYYCWSGGLVVNVLIRETRVNFCACVLHLTLAGIAL